MSLSFENLSVNQSGVVSLEPVQTTTDELLALCGLMDLQVVFLAGAGFSIALWAMFWFGRFRGRVERDDMRRLGDKAHLMTLALLFAMIIARAVRAG